MVLIALGSRGFHWFDSALIGYAVALDLRLRRRHLQIHLLADAAADRALLPARLAALPLLENFRRYTTLIPRAIVDRHPRPDLHPQAQLLSLDHAPVHLLGRDALAVASRSR